MKNQITIIIPTYKRPGFIRRALYYWSAYPVNVIVVDGSPEALFDINNPNLAKNVEYYHLPISLEERFSFVSQKLASPYAAIISDDEFLTYSSLIEAAKIMDTHANVSAVLGATIGFNKIGKQFFCTMHYESAQLMDISGINAKERLAQRLSVIGNSIYYPLVRVEVLQDALNFIAEQHYSCPYIAEYQMEAILCMAGSVKVMPTLMWLRSFEAPMISEPMHDRGVLFHNWINDPNNFVDLERLKISANKHFSKFSISNESVTGDQFVNCFEKYERISLGKKTNLTIIRRIYNYLPVNIRRIAVLIKQFFFRSPPANLKPLHNIIENMKAKNITFDMDELNRIQNIVLKNLHH